MPGCRTERWRVLSLLMVMVAVAVTLGLTLGGCGASSPSFASIEKRLKAVGYTEADSVMLGLLSNARRFTALGKGPLTIVLFQADRQASLAGTKFPGAIGVARIGRVVLWGVSDESLGPRQPPRPDPVLRLAFAEAVRAARGQPRSARS
jgi:hypothetical protein